MNLSTITRQVRSRKLQQAVEGLENVNSEQQTAYHLGWLAGQVQAHEEIAQLLDELDRQAKYGDPLA